MAEHYFSKSPKSEHELQQLNVTLLGEKYTFQTDAGVFSRQEIDQGSKLLISQLKFNKGERVLDLGCGYGPLGIVSARLVGDSGVVDLVDINQRAVELAKKNLALNHITNARAWQSDGFAQVKDNYDWIITNPPIRAGKQVIYPMMEQAYQHLESNGGLLLVIRTRQGAKSMANKLEKVFGNVETLLISHGYRVFKSIKL